ncbi:MAG: hypothetical protein OIF38_12485, partial [Cellvibrionaceae bacterium]|nr:hypothetical protein [Cellvibrionaceae bacterium]
MVFRSLGIILCMVSQRLLAGKPPHILLISCSNLAYVLAQYRLNLGFCTPLYAQHQQGPVPSLGRTVPDR